MILTKNDDELFQNFVFHTQCVPLPSSPSA